MSTAPQASPGTSIPQRSTPGVAPYEAAIVRLGRDLHVGLPAFIQSFDATKQTATVQLAIRDTARISGNPTAITAEPLEDVPVIMPRGGGFSVTIPLVEGDECFVVFADMSIDAWFQSGEVSNQFESRRHDLSDGFCIPGPWSQPNVLSNYSTSALEIRSDDGTISISVNSDNIIIKAPTVTVNAQNVTVMASSNATVSGETVNVTGTSGVTINGSNMTQIDGLVWKSHQHMVGSALSGPPIP